jgi:hypothetical protein
MSVGMIQTILAVSVFARKIPVCSVHSVVGREIGENVLAGRSKFIKM